MEKATNAEGGKEANRVSASTIGVYIVKMGVVTGHALHRFFFILNIVSRRVYFSILLFAATRYTGY